VLGIIGNRQLWATDALFMNDASELHWGQSFFFAQLEDLIANHLANMTADNDETLAKRRLEPSEGLDIIAEAFHKSIKYEGAEYDPGVFAVCFCRNGDLLSQWRGYASFGGGYSIQVSTEQLRAMSRPSFHMSFVKVLYDRRQQERLAKQIILGGLKTLKPCLITHEAVSPARIYAIIGEAIGLTARTFSLRAKNPAFAEEEEWRLLYVTRRLGDLDLPRRFRATARGITPYVEIPTDLTPPENKSGKYVVMPPGFASLPLTGVTVGPTAHTETAERSVRYLLQDYGFDLPVTVSQIPLRG
jgi:hypothetical protein